MYNIKILKKIYIIFQITLNNNSNNIIVYADSDFKINFMNISLLFYDINLYNKFNTIVFIIMRNIIDEKMMNKRYILDINIIIDNKIIILKIYSYIIKSIKTEIILSNDVYNILENRVNLHLYNKII